ncbi:uncharacterized protein VTP21DRAFT_3957 [Calcarisporiella thermophila]|uniref:uncharacterized protein n=1 Tax=Calcarisporiella thermophila TaxID=911321 RepID=UPI00374306FF
MQRKRKLSSKKTEKKNDKAEEQASSAKEFVEDSELLNDEYAEAESDNSEAERDEEDSEGEANEENETDEEEEEGADGEEEDDDGDDEDDLTGLEKPTKKRRKNANPESFADAMGKILGSQLKATDRKQPILARAKGAERKLEEEKLEYKARKILAAEKKKLESRDRVKPDYSNFEYEKKLRKIATRGVVKLFNAIRIQQKTTEEAVNAAQTKSKTTTAIERAKDVSSMSKASFLDLLKSGTPSQASA